MLVPGQNMRIVIVNPINLNVTNVNKDLRM